MKKLFTPLRGASTGAALFLALRTAPLFAQTNPPTAASPLPLSFDPTALLVQAGGFGIAVYLVFWMTNEFKKSLDQNTASVTQNTTSVQNMENSLLQVLNHIKPSP